MRLETAFRIFALTCALGAHVTAWASPRDLSKIREANDWPLTKKTAEQNLKDDPKDSYSLKCLIEAQYNLGDYAGAKKNLVRYQASGASPETINYLSALVETRLRNLPAAKRHAEKLILLGATNPRVLNAIETIFFEVDRRRWVEVCIRNQHADNVLWYLSGANGGDRSKATGELRRMLDEHKFEPSKPNEFVTTLFERVPWQNLNAQERLILAIALAQTNRQAEALQLCESCADQQPLETLKVLNNIVASKYTNLKALLPLLKRMQTNCAGEANYWRLLCLVCKENKSYDEAISAVDRYTKLDSSETALWLNFRVKLIVRTFTRVRPPGQVVLDSLNALIRAYPSSAAYSERVPLLHDLGLYEEELEDIAKVVELSPDKNERIRYLVREADLQYALGDLRSAGKVIEQVLKTDSQNEHCLMLRERVQKEMARAMIR